MNNNQQYDELLDIVDENDRVIGQKYRSEVRQQRLSNFRLINVFLMNEKKELWIPRRAPHKKLFPLCLGSSVGGHVTSGESYDQAFEREVREELNLELADLDYKFVTKLTPQQHNISAYMHIYIVNTNVSPKYNKDDFVEASWMTITDLQAKIKNGERTNEDLPILINILQHYFHTSG
ncbi:MAG: NUDIX domain-containing protein [Candidatus Babeliales bacterium]